MSRDRKTETLERVIAEKTKLHFWGGQWQDGGLTDVLLRLLFSTACEGSQDAPGTILETGAGLSTLAFLATSPERLVSIAPNSELQDRIVIQIAAHDLRGESLEFHCGRSEEVLPKLAVGRPPCLDMALIDGGHGMPTVFVDFCYTNMMLRRGGYLALDDIQLHSVRQLYLLLKHQPGWEIASEVGKLAIFKKLDERPFLPEWGSQPFVAHNS